jgi:hypothetical protein
VALYIADKEKLRGEEAAGAVQTGGAGLLRSFAGDYEGVDFSNSAKLHSPKG